MKPVHLQKVTCAGKVKWFRMDLGYGFVVLLDGPFEGREAMLLMSSCPEFGQALSPGSAVSVTVVPDEKGLRVDRVNAAS